jgi:Ni/Fe-hydrogenase subunit HybB-like protein
MSAHATHPRPAGSPDAILKDIATKLPVRPNARKRMIWMVCLGIGVVALAYLFLTEPKRAWGAYAINTLYFIGIAQGAIVLACAIRMANGRWAGPLMRIAESFSAFLPLGIGLMAVLLVAGASTLLPWVKHVEPRQAPYLNLPFLYIRTLAGLGLLWWLSRDLVRISLRTDAHLLKNHVAPELKPQYEKLSEGWRGDEAEVAWQRDRLSKRAPQIVLLYALVFTVLAWDFVMGLTPEWTSTLFGWWFFMGAFLTGIAMTAFLATQLRAKYRLEAYISSHHFWDIGKILFGFSVFWVYQFWSQYLPIWYANLPEETWWVFLRFEAPWRTLSFTAFGLVFLVPFLGLLNMYTKKSPFWLSVFALIVLTGMWIERHLLVMPSLDPAHVWVGLPEIGVTIGFMGVFGWAVQGFLTKYPTVKVADVLGAGGHGH